MASASTFWVSLLFFLFFNSHIPSFQAQQQYVNNKQLDCNNQYNSTYGNLCNGVNSSCSSYLTFRSLSPNYNTPSSIAYLLNSTPLLIAQANNISDVAVIPSGDMLIVPVNCSCSGDYYQHNASYVLKQTGETYFSVANNTYEALTTCQALEDQNVYQARNLTAGLNLNVPLRCGCPTAKQVASGFKYLLTYLVSEGESVSSIAEIFGVDEQSVLNANELTSNSIVYYFTPIMIPLKQVPSKIQTTVSPPSPSPPPPPVTSGGSNSSKKWIIVGVTVGAVLILLLVLSGFLVCYCRRRRERRKSPKAFTTPTTTTTETTTTTTKKWSDSETSGGTWSLSSEGIRYAVDSLTVYRFEDLEISTNFFSDSNRIKGSVYRATFKGDDAAVKIYKGDVSNEINILKRINHTNITRLSGFCVHKGDTYLVYEFAENGSLDDWLHNPKNSKNQNPISTLNWKQRVQIAHDIAEALNYLHNYANPPHVHKNLKSENILLDGNFRAKISNLGLARVLLDDDDDEEGGFQVTRHVIGTQGYMAPEYIENGVITPKMDVFAFGVVILELISGKEAIVGEEKIVLSSCGREVFEGENVKEKLRDFMDPALGEKYSMDMAYSMAQIAKRCVERDVNSRAAISDVFMTLSKIQLAMLDWDPSDELDRSRSVTIISGGR